MRATLLLLPWLGACAGKLPGLALDSGEPLPDEVVEDPDDTGAALAESPEPADSEPALDSAHTDAHTDPPLDSARDTFVPADTALDSAQPVVPVTTTTVGHVHEGLHAEGQLLHLGPVVVTATRRLLSPPATNGFTVQVPGTPAPEQGLYVDLRDGIGLPAVGDLVLITGQYVEWPPHALAPTDTISRLVVHPSLPGTEVRIVGHGTVPPPLDVTLADLADPATAEALESMLVRVEEGQALDVLARPSPSSSEFPVGIVPGPSVLVDPWWFDYVAALPVRPGATLSALDGVLLYEPAAHKLAPRSVADFEGWTNP
jgi:hypothetical protein